MDEFIYRSNGQPLGFIKNGILYFTNGQALGWKDISGHIWDTKGQFRGTVTIIKGIKYIMKYMFAVSPLPQTARVIHNLPQNELPSPQPYILPHPFPPGFQDGF